MRSFRAIVLAGIAIILTACVQRPDIKSVTDAILVTNADVEAVAIQVADLCDNIFNQVDDSPSGECAVGALIDTALKNELKQQLSDTADLISNANQARVIGNATRADGLLAQADALLAFVETTLSEKQQ
ncbi:MAG: hypothetical protein AAFX44_06710 [Pseudomonadota bacterium]